MSDARTSGGNALPDAEAAVVADVVAYGVG